MLISFNLSDRQVVGEFHEFSSQKKEEKSAIEAGDEGGGVEYVKSRNEKS